MDALISMSTYVESCNLVSSDKLNYQPLCAEVLKADRYVDVDKQKSTCGRQCVTVWTLIAVSEPMTGFSNVGHFDKKLVK